MLTKISVWLLVGAATCALPYAADAQQLVSQPAADRPVSAARQNVPAGAQQAADTAERTAKRYGVGLQGGIALDPELIDVGVHATIGPFFKPTINFRPSIEIGVGEITTLFAINLDVLYNLPGSDRQTRWTPYVGVGPSFGLSHRGFEADDDSDHVDTPGTTTTVATTTVDDRNRFDFSDTDFNGGMNFIVGMRTQRGVFFEMKATAWGVSNVKLLAGFNF